MYIHLCIGLDTISKSQGSVPPQLTVQLKQISLQVLKFENTLKV